MTTHHDTSEAEEMYLITVARSIEDGVGPPVQVSEIAGALEVSTVSANQMIRKLEGVGLVTYAPYKGVTLTSTGEELARTVLRNRRLWGRFLADHLGLSPAKADEVACEMEHVTPDMVAERLSAFLGDPTTGPTGKPIPRGAASENTTTRLLADVTVGESATVLSIGSEFASFIHAQEITEGTEIAVIASGIDGSVLVKSPNGIVHFGDSVAGAIAVSS